MSDILFKGARFETECAVLLFENTSGRLLEVPVDLLTARRILDMMKHIKLPDSKIVEIGNDEESD